MKIAGIVITSIGAIGVLFTIFRIVQDMSGTFLRYTYTSPLSSHETGMLFLLGSHFMGERLQG
ncbi:MAG: hypothetical protein ACE5PV_19935 [Candidatus Poribacteria bacterium]